MRHFSDEMDRMWSRGGYGREGSGDQSGWRPMVDVSEKNGQLQVHADLPGVNDNDVKVSVENDMLIIRGERKREEEREEEGWHRAERSYGSFYRAIPLPEGAEIEKANARFNNGVLEITMPMKQPQQQVKQIPVTNGQGSTQQNTSTTGPQQSSQQSSPQTSQQQPGSEKTIRAGGS
jgi:HSP20 family protein